MRINEIAAFIHADMCNDERNGYSWEERYGEYGNWKSLVIDGREYGYNLGDFDCSSSSITAWAQAVRYTPFEGCFDDAITTHNIRSVFTASGLFDVWDTGSTVAQVGDLYLNDENHVAMCQSTDPDLLSEFSWGDNGAYGNQRGDQSGWESHICGYYDYPWWCTLHYNGGAEGSIDGGVKRGVVQMHAINGNKAQRWKVIREGKYVKFQNRATGWMLDVSDASTAPGTLIQAWKENGNDAQLFKLIKVTGNQAPLYEIAPKIAPDLRLDIKDAQLVDGAVVQLHYQNSNKAQRWALIQNGGGVVNIVSALKTHLALEIKDGR